VVVVLQIVVEREEVLHLVVLVVVDGIRNPEQQEQQDRDMLAVMRVVALHMVAAVVVLVVRVEILIHLEIVLVVLVCNLSYQEQQFIEQVEVLHQIIMAIQVMPLD
jgi:ABC-type uncharacterized transport system permease subunit